MFFLLQLIDCYWFGLDLELEWELEGNLFFDLGEFEGKLTKVS